MKKVILALTATTILATAAYAGGTPGAGFIDSWDYNEDGQVTLEEVTERRSDIFFTFDSDDDGFISAEEYVAFDEARAADQENEGGQGGHGKGNGGQSPSVGMTLEFNDVDGDGQVSREEFTGKTTAWFAMLDRNQDGIVTTDDFGRR